MHADPKNVTIQLSHQYFFTLLGSAVIKAARRMLMELTPGVGQTYHEHTTQQILALPFVSLI